MQTIRKLKKSAKAAAGSALLVGATLTGAASLAAAQDSGSDSMDLGDYPQPFVNENGEVDTTVVVGSQGKQADVVGAINIAGSLGNSAYLSEEVSVDVSGATTSWSATNGATLNRENSQIFFTQPTDAEKSRFDGQDLEALKDNTFMAEDNTEIRVEHDLKVGSQAQEFDKAGNLDNPVLHVNNPQNPEVGNSNKYLLQAEAEMDETIDFTVQSTDASGFDSNADVALEDGDEIRLFGQTYTYSSESSTSELVLYGSSQSFEVNTGEEKTQTVGGEEATFKVDYVSDSTPREATIVVNGKTKSVEEGDSVNVAGQEVRVTNIYRTGPNGQGRVEFSIGSEEITISKGEVQVNDETVDGVDVKVETADGTGDGTFDAVEGFKFAFGAESSSENYIASGEAYKTPVFGLEFHYGGLAPDASEAGDNIGQFSIGTSGSEQASVSFTTSEGDKFSTTWANYNGGSLNLAAGDGEEFVLSESTRSYEDSHIFVDAGNDPMILRVDSIVRDTTDSGTYSEDDEATVTLTNALTGDEIEVTLEVADAGNNNNQDHNYYATESINGGTYHFLLDGSSSGGLQVAWGEGSGIQNTEDGSNNNEALVTGSTTTGAATVFPAVDLQSRASTTFTKEVRAVQSPSDITYTVELPSTQSSNEETVDVAVSGSTVDVDGDNNFNSAETVKAGQVSYTFAIEQGDLKVAPASTATENLASGDTVKNSPTLTNEQSSEHNLTALGSDEDNSASGIQEVRVDYGSTNLNFSSATASVYNSSTSVGIGTNGVRFNPYGNNEVVIDTSSFTTYANDDVKVVLSNIKGEEGNLNPSASNIILDGTDGSVNTLKTLTIDQNSTTQTDPERSTHDWTTYATEDDSGSSLGGINIDYQDVSGEIDVSNVGAGDVRVVEDDGDVYNSGTGISVSSANNGETLKIRSINGDTLEENDQILVNVSDVQGDASDFSPNGAVSDSKIDLNPQDDPTQYLNANSVTSGFSAVLANVLMEPEDDQENEQAYLTTASYDVSNDEVNVNKPSYTGGSSLWSGFQSMDSSDDQVSYDFYGSRVVYNGDEQGEVTFNLPHSQATAGMAVTGEGGSVSASDTASGDVTTAKPTGWPNAAKLDSNVNKQEASNLIMVGGPAVNTLVQDLASQNKTWTADQYSQDTWILDLVEGFSQDQHALVVAGHSAQDTRAASQFLANYQDNQDELAGKSRVSMTTSSSSQ